ncbi:MAG: hypothetical protein P1U63_12945 [Coxiellaceae bacterium]|nr:hypothetical protein [Coxiellaceae bacterium]
MRGLKYFIAVLFFTFSFATAVLAEQCPSITQLRAIFALTNPLPANGKMPYPVDIDDPEFAPGIPGPGGSPGVWFVASRLSFSARGPAIPFVAFCMFRDPSGVFNPSITSADAIARCKSDIDAAGETSVTVDYPHALIGSDPNDRSILYYFDVCLYQGGFNWTLHQPDMDIQTDANLASGQPDIVMADLSPITSSLLKKYLQTHHFHKVTD